MMRHLYFIVVLLLILIVPRDAPAQRGQRPHSPSPSPRPHFEPGRGQYRQPDRGRAEHRRREPQHQRQNRASWGRRVNSGQPSDGGGEIEVSDSSDWSPSPDSSSRFKLDLHPLHIGLIGALGVTLPFLGALALASVDFGEERISGDVTLITFLGGVRNGDAQNLHTGLRLSVSEYFWLEKSGYTIQVQGSVRYQYFSAITDKKDNPARASHLLQFEAMGLLRMGYVGLGMVVGPEVFAKSVFYSPPYRWNLGPVLAFHQAQPTKDYNVLFLINWRPLASLGDLNMELKIDFGALSIGGYFGWMFRDRSDKPSATTLERFISSGGLTVGARIPW